MFSDQKGSFFVEFEFLIKKMEVEFVNEVIYCCQHGLNGRVHDCKIAMHFNCFDQMRNNIMIRNLGSSQGIAKNRMVVNALDRLRGCCHHGLRNLCVCTESA